MKTLLGNLAARILSPIYSGIGSIVMFHRVLPEADKSPLSSNRDLEVTPGYLESILVAARRMGYHVASLAEVRAALDHGGDRKFVAFTTDDAYRDIEDFALPIFEKHGAPLTIYAVSSFHGEKPLLWWYLLQDIILRHDRFRAEWEGRRWDLPAASLPEKDAAFATLARFTRTLGLVERDPFILRLCEASGIDPHERSRERLMSLEQLQATSRREGITIGAHTANHHVMANLTEAQVIEEIRGSKLQLEAWLGRPVEHFAFPFGGPNAVGPRDVAIAARQRFQTITTTRSGTIFRAHRAHTASLPRLNLGGLREDPSWPERAFSGFDSARRNSWKRIITL